VGGVVVVLCCCCDEDAFQDDEEKQVLEEDVTVWFFPVPSGCSWHHSVQACAVQAHVAAATMREENTACHENDEEKQVVVKLCWLLSLPVVLRRCFSVVHI